jgi:glycerol kinase
LVSAERILVIDVGSSSVRAAIVDAESTVSHVHQRSVLPESPEPGMVEFDALAIRDAVLATASAVLDEVGTVAGVGIANQRATTVVWDRASGEPIGPALGWQDLRTVMSCLTLQGEGLRLAPNASATKLQWLLDQYDPSRAQAEQLCFGTLDSWITWFLSRGDSHVTDLSNAAVTGLVDLQSRQWDRRVLDILKVPEAMLPSIVDSSGALARASALKGAPEILGIAGDQQASLIGQGCTAPGLAKITFGTGAMLDLVTGAQAPEQATRGEAGTFPIVAWQRAGLPTWGLEAIMLSAGSCVEWLRDDLGLIGTAEESSELAARCQHSGGAVFVPALLGLGTPSWDFGARGLLLGITRGTGARELVRAVLEGIAQRGRDLVDAAQLDAGMELRSVRIDGGMSTNEVFVAALAEALDRPIEISRQREATTLGAGYLAGIAKGIWRDEADVSAAWEPGNVVEPSQDEVARRAARDRFLEARARAERTIPELSGVSF